jgi:hypothetical protein
MANFLDDIKLFDGDKEAEIYLRCKRLVKKMLEEQERVLEYYHKENNKNVEFTEFQIARLKYALGEIDKHPNAQEYFKKDN